MTRLTLIGTPGRATWSPLQTEFPRPYSKTWTKLSVSATPGRRYGSFAGKAVETQASLTASDTLAVQVIEAPVDSQEIGTYDFLSISLSDSASLFNHAASSDGIAVSLSETIGLVISGVAAKSASDALDVSLADASLVGVTVDATDLLEIDLTDSETVDVSSVEVSATDTLDVSVSDDALLGIFVGSSNLTAEDTLSVALIDQASAIEVQRIRRIALSLETNRIQLEIV